MGLDMKTKQKLSEETAKRYCTANKKLKTKIIDEFIATTGYNRKYAIHILKNTARIKITRFNNVEKKSVQIITTVRKKRHLGRAKPRLFRIRYSRSLRYNYGRTVYLHPDTH